MYTDILYPTDGSAGASAAFDHALELGEQYGATVHVLHAVNSDYVGYMAGGGSEDVPSGMMSETEAEPETGMMGGTGNGSQTGMMAEDHRELKDALERHATSVVESIAGEFGDVDTVATVQVGKPYEAILEYVDDHDIDMIVMGTHGRSGLDRYLLGSVAEKVVRMSDVPVVTIRADEDETASE
ncbi:universal stress protein [Natronococcus sp. A-GB7]|uniref:universal stress protein n=1 Tax=Natronococcus sp. A-GB7 TaxID=3037649 RepID=UPI00241F516C|nr:universal stress protein [Natronococcus sp. A-GB7]MDG5818850.1 universal stress protein [Natronococcus sp. A-GB7]